MSDPEFVVFESPLGEGPIAPALAAEPDPAWLERLLKEAERQAAWQWSIHQALAERQFKLAQLWLGMVGFLVAAGLFTRAGLPALLLAVASGGGLCLAVAALRPMAGAPAGVCVGELAALPYVAASNMQSAVAAWSEALTGGEAALDKRARRYRESVWLLAGFTLFATLCLAITLRP